MFGDATEILPRPRIRDAVLFFPKLAECLSSGRRSPLSKLTFFPRPSTRRCPVNRRLMPGPFHVRLYCVREIQKGGSTIVLAHGTEPPCPHIPAAATFSMADPAPTKAIPSSRSPWRICRLRRSSTSVEPSAGAKSLLGPAGCNSSQSNYTRS